MRPTSKTRPYIYCQTPASAPPVESNSVILTVVEEGPEEEEVMNDCSRAVLYIQTIVYAFINDNWKDIVYVIQIVLLTGYFVYFGFAMAKSFEVDSEPPMRLLVCTIIGILILMTKIFFKIYGYKVDAIYNRTMKKYLKSRGCTRCTRWAKLYVYIQKCFLILVIKRAGGSWPFLDKIHLLLIKSFVLRKTTIFFKSLGFFFFTEY